ncbi:MAG TPA: hypothetical protein VGG94_05705, partial [Chthoniobacterales bacterium]
MNSAIFVFSSSGDGNGGGGFCSMSRDQGSPGKSTILRTGVNLTLPSLNSFILPWMQVRSVAPG